MRQTPTIELKEQSVTEVFLTAPVNRTFWRCLWGRTFLALVAISCSIGQESIAGLGEFPRVPQQRGRMLRVSPPIWPEKRSVDTVLFDGVVLRPSEPESVTFDGREFAADAAVPVLMGVFYDASRPTEDRALALRTLRPVASQLQKSSWITKLVDYTEECEEQDLRLLAMETVAASWDPRGLPLLSNLLASEDDPILRFGMAGTLAAWNVRDGVRLLVDLVDSQLMLSENRPLWSPVLQGLEELNDIKGWGFPMAQVKKEVNQITDLQDRLTVYRQRWKEWYAENEHRFPDWKPGDPLPEVSESQKKTRGDK